LAAESKDPYAWHQPLLSSASLQLGGVPLQRYIVRPFPFLVCHPERAHNRSQNGRGESKDPYRRFDAPSGTARRPSAERKRLRRDLFPRPEGQGFHLKPDLSFRCHPERRRRLLPPESKDPYWRYHPERSRLHLPFLTTDNCFMNGIRGSSRFRLAA